MEFMLLRPTDTCYQKGMRRNRFWSHFILTFVLVTAFLAMQLTTTHAHLNDHHLNESVHHQHQINAHTHNLAGHQAESISFSHPADHEHASHENTIEFDFESNLPKREKQETPSFIVAKFDFRSLTPSTLPGIKISLTDMAELGRPYYSLHNPRAPPQTS